MTTPGRAQRRTNIGSDYDSYADGLDGAAVIPPDLALRATHNLARLVADPDERTLFAAMLGLPDGTTERDETAGMGRHGATGHDHGGTS